MYFEPTKKTYYRFPSTESIKDFDSKYYFPEKPYASGENSHFETVGASHRIQGSSRNHSLN